MQTKESTIKEIKTLLQIAQRELLKEINTQKNFLARVFTSAQSEALKIVQSNLAKALNNIENIGGNDSQTGKLQTNINERDHLIKELETKNQELENQKELAEHKLENSQKELEASKAELKETQEKLAAAKVEPKEAATTATVVESTQENGSKYDELKDLSNKLKEDLSFVQNERDESKKLAVELNKRLKRLKNELIAQ